MMSVHVECPHCHHQLAAPDELRGRRARCPRCAKVLVVSPGRIAGPPLAPLAPLEPARQTLPTPSDEASAWDFVRGFEVPSKIPPRTRQDRDWRGPAVAAGAAILVIAAAVIYGLSGGRESAQGRRSVEQAQAALELARDAARRGDVTQAAQRIDEANRAALAAAQNSAGAGQELAATERAIAELEGSLAARSTPELQRRLIALRTCLMCGKEPLRVPGPDEDVLWVGSVPPGARVYCAYRESIEEQPYSGVMYLMGREGKTSPADDFSPQPLAASHYRGRTPLSLRVPPGDYLVGLAIPIDKQYGNQGLAESPYLPGAGFEVQVAADGKLLGFGRVFAVRKQPDRTAAVSTVFCPRGADYAQLADAFPDRENFLFLESKLNELLDGIPKRKLWGSEGVSAEQKRLILARLRRCGAATWPAKEKESHFVAHALGGGQFELVRLSASVRSLAMPDLPKFDFKVPQFAPIKVPDFRPIMPQIPAIPQYSLPRGTPRRSRSDADSGPRVPAPAPAPRLEPKVSQAPEPTAEERARQRATVKLAVARNFLQGNRPDLARKTLEALVAAYPDTPAAEQARRELEKLQ